MLFAKLHIDVPVFDVRGDKGDFHGGEWPIGPAGSQEVYYQPAAKLHLHLEYAAASYCSPVYGAVTQRRFAIIFQCAAKPGERLKSGYPGSAWARSPELAGLFTDRYHGKDSEWTFKPEHVRPYGILLANVSHLKDVFGTEMAAWKGRSIDLDF